jgi:hypothetical protein
MLRNEINLCLQDSSAAAAMRAREFAEPEVALCQPTEWRTAETKHYGQNLFMTPPKCRPTADATHGEATV